MFINKIKKGDIFFIKINTENSSYVAYGVWNCKVFDYCFEILRKLPKLKIIEIHNLAIDCPIIYEGDILPMTERNIEYYNMVNFEKKKKYLISFLIVVLSF